MGEEEEGMNGRMKGEVRGRRKYGQSDGVWQGKGKGCEAKRKKNRIEAKKMIQKGGKAGMA